MDAVECLKDSKNRIVVRVIGVLNRPCHHSVAALAVGWTDRFFIWRVIFIWYPEDIITFVLWRIQFLEQQFSCCYMALLPSGQHFCGSQTPPRGELPAPVCFIITRCKEQYHCPLRAFRGEGLEPNGSMTRRTSKGSPLSQSVSSPHPSCQSYALERCAQQTFPLRCDLPRRRCTDPRFEFYIEIFSNNQFWVTSPVQLIFAHLLLIHQARKLH